MTSAAAATARGESAQVAPAASRGSALSRVRLYTVVGYPAAIRCPHIDWPMTPVPIQPTRGRAAAVALTSDYSPGPGMNAARAGRPATAKRPVVTTDSLYPTRLTSR